MGVNKVILLGRLGKDPELRYTPTGQAVANFTVATSERLPAKDGQRQERTEWHNVVAWGKTGELVNQYLKKGNSVYLEGRITTRSWDDKEGKKNYRTEIVALTVEFINGPSGGESRSAQPSHVSSPQHVPMMNEPQDIPVEDDLPF
jgi:single-strand DNA-binding protein